jgi:hypothetical protein
MEPNNQEFSKPNYSKIIKRIFLVFVSICIILIVVMALLITKQNATQALAVQNKQVNEISSYSLVKLPAISTKTIISSKDFPQDLSQFVSGTAINQAFYSISYADGNSGFMVIYVIPNAMLKPTQDELYKKFGDAYAESNWFPMSSVFSSSSFAGVIEVKNIKTGESGRMVFLQQGNNVRVNFLSMSVLKK